MCVDLVGRCSGLVDVWQRDEGRVRWRDVPLRKKSEKKKLACKTVVGAARISQTKTDGPVRDDVGNSWADPFPLSSEWTAWFAASPRGRWIL